MSSWDNFDGMSECGGLSPSLPHMHAHAHTRRSISFFPLFSSGLIVISIIVWHCFAPFPRQHNAFALLLRFFLCLFISVHDDFSVESCLRLRAECIIVETVKSLTGRDTIYIYGFRFTMLHLILMQNTSTRTHTHPMRERVSVWAMNDWDETRAQLQELWQVNE